MTALVLALALALTSVALALAWPWSYVCGLGLALCGLVNIPVQKCTQTVLDSENLNPFVSIHV